VGGTCGARVGGGGLAGWGLGRVFLGGEGLVREGVVSGGGGRAVGGAGGGGGGGRGGGPAAREGLVLALLASAPVRAR